MALQIGTSCGMMVHIDPLERPDWLKFKKKYETAAVNILTKIEKSPNKTANTTNKTGISFSWL